VCVAPPRPRSPQRPSTPFVRTSDKNFKIQTMSRTVLLHYHLFKNAGTSLDEVLKHNFGAGWVTREFERRATALHRKEIAQWITDTPAAQAFSSHTLEAPPPAIPDVKVVPLIFIRHPLDRIASAYAFERKQGVNAGFGAALARYTTLEGYIAVRMAIPRDRQCRDFHIERLAMMAPDETGTEQERAMSVLNALPFVGIVEDFGGSMSRLAALCRRDFPSFKPRTVAANVSREHSRPLEQKLADLQQEIGADLYQQLEVANAADLALYQTALKRAGAAPTV
jgi:hypothetical protein